MTRRVTLGRVAGVYGVKGWVKVVSHTRPIENILDYPNWWLATRQPYESEVVEAKMHGRGIIAQLSDAGGKPIDDRDVAAALIGTEIQVAQDALPEAPAGQYYWSQLEGLKVQNLEGVGLGTVTSVTSNGAQDVLVIKDGEADRLIPFVRGPLVKSVDLQQGLIVVDWQPEY